MLTSIRKLSWKSAAKWKCQTCTVCMGRGKGEGLGGTLCLLCFHFFIMRLENYCQTNSLNNMNSIHLL